MGHSQDKNVGIPFITNYSSVEYGMHPKNYSIAQDEHGVMYLGNEYGVLEYDGSKWNPIHLPNGINATVIHIASSGQIYVGSEESIGYLERRQQGSWSYKALSIPSSTQTPFTISNIYSYQDTLFFTAEKQIFKYQQKDSVKQVFTTDSNIEFSTAVQDFHLTKTRNNNLLWMLPDEVKELPFDGFEKFEVVELLPYGDHDILAITAKDGLWVLEGKKLIPLKIDFSSSLRQAKITSAIALKNGHFALGSYQNGVFIFHKNGHLLHHITKEKGLNSNTVNSLYESKDQNLWVALDNGLSYIELHSAFTKYEEFMGFEGMIFTSVIHQGKLYVGTTQGLYVSNWQGNTALTDIKFDPVKGIQGQVWSLYSTENQLLCGHENGVFEIEGQRAIRRSTSSRVWTFLESEYHSESLLVGTLSGIEVFKKKASKFSFSHPLENFQESSRILAEDKDGSLWVCHGNKGLFHLKLHPETLQLASQKLYAREKSQNGFWFTSVAKSQKNGVLFSSNRGLYQFDEDQQSFVLFDQIQGIPKDRLVNRIQEDEFGNLWVIMEGELLLLKLQEDGNYSILENNYLSKARNVMIGSYEHIHVHDRQNVFIAAQNGMLHLDPTFFTQQHLNESREEPMTLIRQFETIRSKDSLLFEGILNDQTTESQSIVELPYSMNSIRFTYSVPAYDNGQHQDYQFALENKEFNQQDPINSPFTTSTQKEFTNLTEGTYTFRVKGRNSQEAQVTFTVKAPWYRTLWAYFVYVILILVFVLGLIKVVGMQHQKEKQRIQASNERELREQQLIAEKEKFELRNEQLAEEIKFKNKEMASVVMQITQKNEFLMHLRNSLKQVTKSTDGKVHNELQSNIREIDMDMRLDKNWEKFQFYFDQVHQDFLDRLRTEFPELSSTTLKMCAFIRIGLSTKEIATLMNISISGAEKRRYRLRKKLQLDQEINLTSFLKNY